ncbi:MAG: TIGR00268 family protein [Candidatus Electrothrix sp. AS4_5]|nr:TIGR00268 family protein [Candidatus Electrothrix gigas]
MNSKLEHRQRQLCRHLSGFNRVGRVGIAFSGGVDSSFLLRSALDVLGPKNVLVLHARSCLQKKQEQQDADTWAERHGYPVALLEQRIIRTEPLTWDDFVANPENRCYLCKRRLYSLFLKILAQEGISTLLDGTNTDDLSQGETGRPGLRVLFELGIHTPLADCGLDKKTIRLLSQDMGLDTANKPSSSCLATRIPHNMSITSERLNRIATLEQTLEAEGFIGCRIRLLKDLEETFTVQLQEASLSQLSYDAIKKNLLTPLKKKKVRKIYLDVEAR